MCGHRGDDASGEGGMLHAAVLTTSGAAGGAARGARASGEGRWRCVRAGSWLGTAARGRPVPWASAALCAAARRPCARARVRTGRLGVARLSAREGGRGGAHGRARVARRAARARGARAHARSLWQAGAVRLYAGELACGLRGVAGSGARSGSRVGVRDREGGAARRAGVAGRPRAAGREGAGPSVLGEERGKKGRRGREKRKREKRRRNGRKKKEKGEKKWRKREEEMGKGKEKGGGECAPAAAAVGHARRRSRVRGPGEVGHTRRLRPSGARVHAAGRRGRKEREKKRREIRGDDRDGW